MNSLENLKQKLDEKIDNEFANFIEELKKFSPNTIIDKAYEIISKEEMIYKIKDKEYSISELKALLNSDNILDKCYDEWLKRDGNFNEVLEYTVNDRIDLIIRNYKEKNKKQMER